jgi:putative membrane protein
MGGFGWFGALVVFAIWILFITGLVLLIVWLVRSSNRQQHGGGMQWGTPRQEDEAVEIARRRYAAGEITAEQYEEMLRRLGGP